MVNSGATKYFYYFQPVEVSTLFRTTQGTIISPPDGLTPEERRMLLLFGHSHAAHHLGAGRSNNELCSEELLFVAAGFRLRLHRRNACATS